MDWLPWLVFGAIVFAGLGLLVWRALRWSARGRRFLSLSTRGKVAFGRALLTGPGVPLPARAVVAVLVGYLALPLDLIPDFIPVVGQLDDFFVVMGAVALLLVLVPRSEFDRAMDTAELSGA